MNLKIGGLEVNESGYPDDWQSASLSLYVNGKDFTYLHSLRRRLDREVDAT